MQAGGAQERLHGCPPLNALNINLQVKMFDFSGVRLRVHIYENRRKERERERRRRTKISRTLVALEINRIGYNSIYTIIKK
jgi:hypothetical protein